MSTSLTFFFLKYLNNKYMYIYVSVQFKLNLNKRINDGTALMWVLVNGWCLLHWATKLQKQWGGTIKWLTNTKQQFKTIQNKKAVFYISTTLLFRHICFLNLTKHTIINTLYSKQTYNVLHQDGARFFREDAAFKNSHTAFLMDPNTQGNIIGCKEYTYGFVYLIKVYFKLRESQPSQCVFM